MKRPGPPGTPPGLPFAAVGDLDDRPHVVVDGAARATSVLSLTHWPSSRTPTALARDLSAEIAVAYLGAPAWWAARAEAVTNDHVDQDGLASLYLLVDPPAALVHAPLLVEVARVGDFDVVRDATAAKVAFALAALADPARSPFRLAEAPRSPAWTAACYLELLARLPELLEHPDRSRALFEGELAALDESRRALRAGRITIAATKEPALALVTVDEDLGLDATSGPDLAGSPGTAVHRAALNSATDAVRLLVVQGRRYRYVDRYETWVRFVSRPLPLRRDLGPLAERLSGEERGPVRWEADPPGALEPVLTVADRGESSLEPARVAEIVGDYLAGAPPAWDPWCRDGPLVSGREGPTVETSGRGRPRWRGPRRGRTSA